MLAKYQKTSSFKLIIGFLLMVTHLFIPNELMGQLWWWVGYLIFIWGCTHYAKAKGYAWWYGLTGIFSIFGFLFLMVLPDEHSWGK